MGLRIEGEKRSFIIQMGVDVFFEEFTELWRKVVGSISE